MNNCFFLYLKRKQYQDSNFNDLNKEATPLMTETHNETAPDRMMLETTPSRYFIHK